jgi:hypothetical protein
MIHFGAVGGSCPANASEAVGREAAGGCSVMPFFRFEATESAPLLAFRFFRPPADDTVVALAVSAAAEVL